MLRKSNSSAAARRLFLRAKKGMFICSRGDFHNITGTVRNVEYREHIAPNGQRYNNWHILMDDDECGEYYDIAFGDNCDGFGYILSALLTPVGQRALTTMAQVTIDVLPYKMRGTKAVVSLAKKTIACGERMPDLVRTAGGGRPRYDDRARKSWLLSAMARVNSYIERSGGDGTVW